ncbi:MAG: flagellar export protein FliJ [Fibrobacterota bacterium]
MQAFHFTLETLLQLRMMEEEKVLNELAEKEREIQEERNLLHHAQKEYQDFIEQQRTERSHVDARRLRYSVSWRNQLKRAIILKNRDISEVEYDIRLIQKRVETATQRRKALEKLREKQYAQWKKEYDRRQQEFLDELAQNQYRRNH